MISLLNALKKCDDTKLLIEIEKIFDGSSKYKFNVDNDILYLSEKTVSTYFYIEFLRQYHHSKRMINKRIIANNIFILTGKNGENIECFDSFIIKEEDAKLLSLKFSSNKNNEKNNKDIEVLVNDHKIKTYNYSLLDIDQVLGYYILESSIAKYGLEKNLAIIMFELTLFGYDSETIKANLDEIKMSFDKNNKSFENLIEKMMDKNHLKIINKHKRSDK